MPIKILIVEDNPDHVLLTKRILEKTAEDYQIDSTLEAREGLRKIFQESYDLVLCDYNLPDLSGLDILKEMRKKGKDLPFIVVTSTGSEKVAVELMKEGAYDYVVKDSLFEGTLPVVIQRAIDRYNAYKEKERLEQELMGSNKKLKEMYENKSEFISMVSHELRTPLTTIREAVAQVSDGLFGAINKEQNEFLSICLGDIDRLGRIVNNLLDISRMEAGKLELKRRRVELNDLIKKACQSFELQLKEKGLQLIVNVPTEEIEVYIDADKIVQVFTNLIGNALKFTEKGHIEISALEKENEIECSVSDTGIGISEEQLPKLFKKFQQVGGDSEVGKKGSGLGLSITKGIVELHAGSIRVESKSDQGSRFIFTLPKYSLEVLLHRKIEDSIAEAKERCNKFFIYIVKLDNALEMEQKLGESKVKELFLRILQAIEDTLEVRDFAMVKGEDEIVILIEETKQAAFQIKKRLNKLIKELIFGLVEEPRINFLIGCSMYPDDGSGVEQLIDKAEKDLVNEKEGRLSKNIMIVDDEHVVVESLKENLKRFGYTNIIEAYDGSEALEKIRALTVELLILDMKMPKMSGYEVIGRLKEDVRTKDLPIVVISGYEIESDKLEEYTEKKAIPMVNKPFNPEQIERLVNYFL